MPWIVLTSWCERLLAELVQVRALHSVMDQIERSQFRRKDHPYGMLGLLDLLGRSRLTQETV
ncbi:hypothetical protein SHJG_1427 [Streptomyces hygroscopicus subsp. jinggangensis 5008]|nr:hypothetical protein SHJG_1427 [Streptomyces hygroscopicus subsp. jinggangensis 5008]AGF60926.1 hypothetical protein SHJGH_1260 [Streptomyces hygroscopicus subsp. jinggangensis TL01]